MLNVNNYAMQLDSSYTHFHFPVEWTLHTDGRGYWSNVRKAVRITAVGISVANGTEGYDSDLQVYFYEDDWNCAEDGLIYTDKLFLRELKAAMLAMGFNKDAVEDVCYSEQGMQDDDYVSLDAYELCAWLRSELTVAA